MTRCVLALVLTAILVVPPGLSPAALADSATDYLRARIERIYDVLGSAGSAAAPDRMAAARATLDEMFDWPEMGKQSLGQYWQERSPAERAEFVQLFATLFQRTYLSRIEVADRGRFQYLGETSDGDVVIVKTVVVTQKGGQIFPVDYVARRAGDQWKVHDLSVSGTSLVNNYRAQFTTLVARSSYQDLVQKLRELVGRRPGTSQATSVVLVGASDIASCTSDGDEGHGRITEMRRDPSIATRTSTRVLACWAGPSSLMRGNTASSG